MLAQESAECSVELKNYHNDPNRGDIENPLYGTVGSLRGNYSNIVYKRLHARLWGFIGLLVPIIKHIQGKKLIHHQALHLVKCLCEEIKSLNDWHSYSFHFGLPVTEAARLGIPEIVEEIVGTYPDAVWYYGVDKRNILQIAVVNRCEKLCKCSVSYSGLSSSGYVCLPTSDIIWVFTVPSPCGCDLFNIWASHFEEAK
ncbi:hypothetical protein F0562_022486 [Nyssa sinensis]|uniref:Uncharacterized protein n=1 Tax=Nyssa sinensis TaxID=561372 RepID=A0A5J5BPC1_9ASTE|nr:hypothetical protein F0562_022486 [Nyssa sinensis]